MDFIIFGAGNNGRATAKMLGYDRVAYFIDNKQFGQCIDGIQVITVKQAKKLKDKYLIIIASLVYYKEMVVQLEEEGIHDYIIYGHPYIYPQFHIDQKLRYMKYREILDKYEIKKYNKIAIYGSNSNINRLLDEIYTQCSCHDVIGIIYESDDIKNNSVPEISLDHALSDSDCIVINKHRDNSDIRFELMKRGYAGKVIDIFNIDEFIPQFRHDNLKKYKDIHKGKRCFLIGNGPSLIADDLTKLHKNNEICFACNKINEIFSQTSWRPDYYGVSDSSVIAIMKDKFDEIGCVKFIADYYEASDRFTVDIPNVEYFHYQFGGMINHPGFSDDPSLYCCEGGTALYDINLHMAIYMGFNEIYLLGVDNSIMMTTNDHFTTNYQTERDINIIKQLPKPAIPDSADGIAGTINRCFEVAHYYCKNNGIKIFNATRGGYLNSLPRIDFDSIF